MLSFARIKLAKRVKMKEFGATKSSIPNIDIEVVTSPFDRIAQGAELRGFDIHDLLHPDIFLRGTRR